MTWGGDRDCDRDRRRQRGGDAVDRRPARPVRCGHPGRCRPGRTSTAPVTAISATITLAHSGPGTYYVADGGCASDPALGGEFEMLDPRGPGPGHVCASAEICRRGWQFGGQRRDHPAASGPAAAVSVLAVPSGAAVSRQPGCGSPLHSTLASGAPKRNRRGNLRTSVPASERDRRSAAGERGGSASTNWPPSLTSLRKPFVAT